MSKKSDYTPRLPLIQKQIDFQADRLQQLFEQSDKLQAKTIDKAWDLYRKLIEMQNTIKQYCGTPPADILMQSNDIPVDKHELSVLIQTMQSSIEAMTMQSNVTENITERIVERTIKRRIPFTEVHK